MYEGDIPVAECRELALLFRCVECDDVIARFEAAVSVKAVGLEKLTTTQSF